ncbi:Carboxypeptidase S [Pleurostoma richardsiae]|uniref:Carboxypeptidase S n=1 Tax=Pleurostoma richardsiae TaxID=41990 RepID=A0AA38RM13_9PEZI|nr:Carboxypeptidase S [Pleurostoma richardsiae]
MRLSKLALLASLTPQLSATPQPVVLGSRSGDQHVIAVGSGSDTSAADFQCDLPNVLEPSQDGLPSATDLFGSQDALLKQVSRHSAIVRVPSICYDDLGDFDSDERWAPFYELHKVLSEQYPLIHSRFTIEKVNTFGLLYTLKGRDSSLKPLMLTAHQDVVPVADASTWTHPPFSAHFDGTWLWGRGASDDKNSLTGLMSAVETLLSQENWVPKRTILIALGFDEECSGRRGAGYIARHIESTWGNDSIAMILDEGGMGLQLIDGVLYALPAVMEKGHADIWFELHVQGGHSSVPFPHTGIGIISEIVTTLEENPYKAKLMKGSPIYNHFVCQARYSPDAEPKITKLLKEGDLEALTEELISIDRPTHFRLQTSQAVDKIAGGQKINAMPEVVTLGVNYRVAPQNTIPEIQHNILKYIKPIIKKYHLTIKAFEGDDEFAKYEFANGEWSGDFAELLGDPLRPFYDVDYNGTLVLSSSQRTLVAPVSPTSGDVWDVLSGTIQYSFAFKDGKVVPVGELMTGNTDTRHYLSLTRNIYRWTPTRQGGSDGVHTIDERMNMTVHLEAVRFYYNLVRNFDTSDA